MIKINILLLFMVTHFLFSQSTREIIQDFDGDLKKDTVRIDSDKNILISILSTQNYKRVTSKEIKKLNFGNTLVKHENGFEFWNDFDRSGFRCIFEYKPNTKKFQLTQIIRTDDTLVFKPNENAMWRSQVNLLNNEYIGGFYDVYNGVLEKKSIVKAKLVLPITFLNTFSDDLLFNYESKCLELSKIHKN